MRHAVGNRRVPTCVSVVGIILMPDGAICSELLSGDIQIAGGISPRTTHQIEASPGYTVFETKSGNYTDLVMRLDAAPTNNPDFVLAMKYLMNRTQMRSAIMKSHRRWSSNGAH